MATSLVVIWLLISSIGANAVLVPAACAAPVTATAIASAATIDRMCIGTLLISPGESPRNSYGEEQRLVFVMTANREIFRLSGARNGTIYSDPELFVTRRK